MSIKNFWPQSYIKEMDNGYLGIDWFKFSDDWKADHDCKMVERVTVRTLSNGNVAHYIQCPICGNGRAIKKSDVPPGGHLQWDDGISKRRQEEWLRCRDQLSAALEARKSSKTSQWWQWYNAYLKTPECAARRDKVLKRCNYICQGCGERRAILAHHLTYDRAGAEMLFDLVGLCQQCHDQLHPK